MLLAAGADVNLPSNDGTPLVFAARSYPRVAKMLLAKGADPNKSSDSEGTTAIMVAASLRDTEVAQALLAAGADVNARDKDGATPLVYGAWVNNPEYLEVLIDAGAQIETRVPHGRTALTIAVMRGNVDAARVLIKRGARTDLVDEENISITGHAQRLKDERQRVRMLALLGQKP
jgi:ankyrin repeat protein